MRMRSIFAALLLSCTAIAPLTAQDTGWLINSFAAAYRINPDRTIDVAERINVDFGSLQKHGIYRDIPVTYRKTVNAGIPIGAGKVKVDIHQISATDGDDNPIGIKVTRGSMVRIRLGDADRTVSGKQSYIIRYQLERGLGFFDDHDELYWQVTGTNWPVPILKASATVSINGTGAASTGWDAWCYAGWSDSNDNSRCTAKVDDTGGWQFASGRLDPGEGLTMVASFPKGIIAAPTAADVAKRKLGIFWPLGIPLVMLGLMLSRWRKIGREPPRGSVVPYWKPPTDLRPGPAGTLWDQTTNMNDIVATLLDLAVRGVIRITEVPPDGLLGSIDEKSFAGRMMLKLGITHNDWELERLDSSNEPTMAPYESLVLGGIFEGSKTRRMSDLTNDFYTSVPGINKALYQSVVDEGLFTGNPNKVRMRYGIIGFIIMMIGIPIGIATQNIILGAGCVLAGIVVIAFSSAMPARTIKGARLWEQLRGLEEYIRRAEKLELEMTQGPERTTKLFETLLPYAVALKVSDIWVKQFGPILASNPPTWYVGMNPSSFSSHQFSSALSNFQTAATRTLGSSPGSSSGSGGGGSVGGGGGGGGGGSW